jgi:hypothetical protein
MGLRDLSTSAVRDTYFSLWTLTEKGITDPAAVQATIEAASAMIASAKAECHFYLAIGGAYDYIGVAKGAQLNDTKIVAIQHAIEAYGTLSGEFIATTEKSLKDFAAYIADVKKMGP